MLEKILAFLVKTILEWMLKSSTQKVVELKKEKNKKKLNREHIRELEDATEKMDRIYAAKEILSKA